MKTLKSIFVALLLTMPLATFAQIEANDGDDEFDVTFDNKTTNTTPKISNRKATQTTPQGVQTLPVEQTLTDIDEFGDTLIIDEIVPQAVTVPQIITAPTNVDIDSAVQQNITTIDDADMPEGLTSTLDSLLTLYNNQTYIVNDSECNFPNYNPVYDDSTYIERLQKLPTIFEMPYNSVVRQMIDRYTARNRYAVSVMLATQNFYMPIFEQALEAYGLPLELKYLPVIESGLNPKAVSRAGATGLWQFMLATGKQYGLEVNSLVDERCDPVKSSYAAAKMLSDMYKIFGDWSLVIAAYNCGPGNVTKAIHRAGGVYDYWKIYPYLPHETRGYVPAFIAANYVMNYYCEHNICPMLSRLPEQTDTVMVSRDIHFDQISKVLNIPISQLQELNPQYRKNIVNGSSSRPAILRLPAQMTIAFVDKEQQIYDYSTSSYRPKRATVTPGYDGPSTAATQPAPTPSSAPVVTPATTTASAATPAKTTRSHSRYQQSSQTTQATQSSRSGRNSGTQASSRTSKRNSGSQQQTSKKPTKKQTAKKPTTQQHTIREGESLEKIAKRNGTTVKELKRLNPNIKGDKIRAGKQLRVK